jgi:hypothetical protein
MFILQDLEDSHILGESDKAEPVFKIQKAMVEEWSENSLICAVHFGHCDGGLIYDGMSGIKIGHIAKR